MKILVTGANGYIGSKVVKQLCDFNVEVIATDFKSNHIDPRAKFIEANIFESKDDWFAFFEKPDACLHLAWRDVSIHNSENHMKDVSKHFQFLTNLIRNGLKQICLMGTMTEVGYWEGAIDENTPCVPLCLYGIAKNALRQSIELFIKQHDCKYQWIRAYYSYSDDIDANNIFGKIRQAVRDGKKTFPFTTGKNKYDFLEIDELAKQIALCVMQDKVLGIINVCSGKPVSLADQVEWFIKHNNLDIILEYGKYPDRPYDSPCTYGDNTKILEIMKGAKYE